MLSPNERFCLLTERKYADSGGCLDQSEDEVFKGDVSDVGVVGGVCGKSGADGGYHALVSSPRTGCSILITSALYMYIC